MEPNGDGPVARVERTFWTVWCYISEAVNRFLRPELANSASNDPNREPTASGHTGGNARGEGFERELPLPQASLLRSSGVVVWDAGLGADEGQTQRKVEMTEDTEGEASGEQESKREERFDQAGSEDAGYTRVEKGTEEENKQKGEGAIMAVLTLTDDAETEDVTGGRMDDDAEEETPTTMTLNIDPEKTDENATEVEINEEDNEIQLEENVDLDALGVDVKKCRITDGDVKEEENGSTDEAEDTEEVEKSVSVIQMTSENGEQLSESHMDLGKVDVEQVMVHRAERDEDEEDESMLHGRDHPKTEMTEDLEVEASEDQESRREERFDQAGSEDEDYTRAEEGTEEENKQKEERAKMEKLTITDDAETEDVTGGRMEDDAEEETPTTMTLNIDPEKTDESATEVEINEEDNEIEEEGDLDELGVDVKICTITDDDVKEEENGSTDEAEDRGKDEDTEEVEKSVSVIQMTSENGEQLSESHMDLGKVSIDVEQVMVHRAERDEDEEDEEDESMLHGMDHHKTEMSEDIEVEASEDQESRREERFDQAGSEDEGYTRAEEGTEEENKLQKSPEHDGKGEHAIMAALTITDDVETEDVTGGRMEDDGEEETPTTMTLNIDPEKTDKTTTEVEINEEDNEIQLEENVDLEELGVDVKKCTITDDDVKEEENRTTDEDEDQGKDEDTETTLEEVEKSVSVIQMTSENGEQLSESHMDLGKVSIDVEQVMVHRAERDEDEEDEEDESMLHERDHPKTEMTEDNEGEASEDQESRREERFEQAGSEDEGYTRAEEGTEEENKQKGEGAIMAALTITDDVETEDVTGGRMEDDAEEETPTTMTLNIDPEKTDENATEVEINEEDNEIQLEENVDLEELGVDVKKGTITDDDVKEEENRTTEETEDRGKDEDTEENGEQLSESHMDLGKVGIDVEQVMVHRAERDEDEEDEEDESILHERDQREEENMTEAVHEQTVDEKLQWEDGLQNKSQHTETEDGQEEDTLSEDTACREEVRLIANTEQHTAKQKDVAKMTKTKTTEADYINESVDEYTRLATTDVSDREICSEKGQVEVKRTLEIACAVTTVTVKPEGETGQEASGMLENIPLRVCEGRVVVSPWLNSPTCEETQEGVPEYNNEPGPDENTSRTFLEVGDCEEIQANRLPEEAESLQSSGSNAGTDYLSVRGHREEEQENTEDNDKEPAGVLRALDAGLPQDGVKIPGVLSESVLVDSMKTVIKQSEKVSETDIVLADEATTGLHDKMEELLVELRAGGRFVESRDATGDTAGAVAAGEEFGFADETPKSLDTEEEQTMDTSVLQELVDTNDTDDVIPGFLVDVTESQHLGESVETDPKTHGDLEINHGDFTVEMQDAVRAFDGTGSAEHEAKSKSCTGLLDLQLEETAAESTEEADLNEGAVNDESKLDEAFEISHDEMSTSAEGSEESLTAEFRSENLTKPVTESEETSSGHQDVIEEEILDLWIQAVSSEDGDQMKQRHGSEPGPQTDAQMPNSQEEQAEILEMEKEHLVESGMESGLVSDTEMSSCTAESGFLDQSLTSEWDALTSETRPHRSTSTESFPDNYEMLASMSEPADTSKEQDESESQEVLTEDAAEAEQMDLKEDETRSNTSMSSGAAHPTLEPYKSQAEISEPIDLLDTETGFQKNTEILDPTTTTDWKEAGEADIESQMGEENVEKTKAQGESLDTTHVFTDEIKLNESSDSVVLLDEIKSTSQDDTWAGSKNLFKSPSQDETWPECPEDFTESLPEPHMEALEHLSTGFEDLLEVDDSLLDFTAQKMRIAVKNPRVRPPKDPRSLLHMPSLEPTPSAHLPVKVPAGLPLGGLGVGIKLPGLGAGFPVLKKTKRVVTDENSPETPREPETKPEDKSDPPKQDEVQQKPRWMPPKHPGFGNPLMSELKTKLKKTPKE